MRDADDEGLDVAVTLARERKRSRVYETPKYDGNVFSNADSCNRVRKQGIVVNTNIPREGRQHPS